MRYSQLIKSLPIKQNPTILAIESSCDETAAAILKDGKISGSVIASQAELHKKYGGVVPEIASRKHTESICACVNECLTASGTRASSIDAVAVTHGPGLVGALLVGVSYAKGFAYNHGIPLIPVHHIEGHICANYLAHKMAHPFICLVVSGGHTQLVKVMDERTYLLMGVTRDDAAGEALDKAARTLGLSYPGGPNLERLASSGSSVKYIMPMPLKGQDTLDFSFSGLKTHVINLTNKMNMKNQPYRPEDVAACFQKAVVDLLCKRAIAACESAQITTLAISGGVAANNYLKERLHVACGSKIQLLYPPKEFCTDNADMIAIAALHRYKARAFADLSLNASPSVKMNFIPET